MRHLLDIAEHRALFVVEQRRGFPGRQCGDLRVAVAAHAHQRLVLVDLVSRSDDLRRAHDGELDEAARRHRVEADGEGHGGGGAGEFRRMAGNELQIDDGAARGAALGEHLLHNGIERLRQRRQSRDFLALLAVQRADHRETKQGRADQAGRYGFSHGHPPFHSTVRRFPPHRSPDDAYSVIRQLLTFILPRESGGGGARSAPVGASAPEHKSVTQMQTAPPRAPSTAGSGGAGPFARSPSPAFAGADKHHRSRDACAPELCQRHSQRTSFKA